MIDPSVDYSRWTRSHGAMLRHLAYADSENKLMKTSALPIPIYMLYHADLWASADWDISSILFQISMAEGISGRVYRQVDMGDIWGKKYVPFYPKTPINNSDLIGGIDTSITLRKTIPFECRGWLSPDVINLRTVLTGETQVLDLETETELDVWTET